MEDFIKKYIRIIVLSVILLFASAFIVFYGTNDLFKFPFDSNVWGNAADWCMTIVTLFTAIYLVRTFREQQKITNIEHNRYLKEIQPVPEVYIKNNSVFIKFVRNQAFNIVIDIERAKNMFFRKTEGKYNFEMMPINNEFRLDDKFDDLENDNEFIQIDVHFSDNIKNKYKQSFIKLNSKHFLKMELKVIN